MVVNQPHAPQSVERALSEDTPSGGNPIPQIMYDVSSPPISHPPSRLTGIPLPLSIPLTRLFTHASPLTTHPPTPVPTSPPFQSPPVPPQVFNDRFGNPKIGIALQIIPIGCVFFCLIATTTYVARIMFCYSRDRAVPLSGLWQKVDKRTKLPLNALWVSDYVILGCRGLMSLHQLAVVTFCHPNPTASGYSFCY